MPVLKNVELWFPRLSKPSNRLNPENPTWEVQVRTTSKEEKKTWEAAGYKVKAVVPDDGPPYFCMNLKKKSIKMDKTPADPPRVVDAGLRPIDPRTIGNGSFGNVEVFNRDSKEKATGKDIVIPVLMGVQILRHVIFEWKAADGFANEGVTETIVPEDNLRPPDSFSGSGDVPTFNPDDDIPF